MSQGRTAHLTATVFSLLSFSGELGSLCKIPTVHVRFFFFLLLSFECKHDVAAEAEGESSYRHVFLRASLSHVYFFLNAASAKITRCLRELWPSLTCCSLDITISSGGLSGLPPLKSVFTFGCCSLTFSHVSFCINSKNWLPLAGFFVLLQK